MSRISTVLFWVGSLMALGSCDKEDANPDRTLVNKRWMLVQVETTPIAVSSYGPTYRSYIEFSEENTTSGLAPCNSFGGTFSQGAAGELTISEQASTRIACPTPIEHDYLTALPRTARYEISGKQLRLYAATQASVPLLVFENRGK